MKFDCLKSVTIEPVLFLYMFGTFMQYVAFQDVVYQKSCASTFNISVCQDLYSPTHETALGIVERAASMWILISTTALCIPSVVLTIFLGSWGDTYGRKMPLLLPPVGAILNSIVFICLSTDKLEGPLWPIILANLFSGLCGGFVSCIMAVMSYISSISTVQSRTSRLSLVEAMTFLGGTTGPFAGGAILKAFGPVTVFVIIALCHLLSLLYIIFCVPQVSPAESSESNESNKLCSSSHLTNSLKVCLKQRENSNRTAILLYLASALVIMITSAGEVDISYLFVKDTPLEWDSDLYSYYFGLRFALGSLMLILGTYLKNLFKLNISDHTFCMIGMLSKFAGYVIMGYSSTTILMFLAPVISVLNVFCLPSLRSLLSKQVEADELGKLFACVASIENVCTLLGSLLFNSLYPVMRDLYRGSSFHLAAGLLIIPLFIISQTMLWRDHDYTLLENENDSET